MYRDSNKVASLDDLSGTTGQEASDTQDPPEKQSEIDPEHEENMTEHADASNPEKEPELDSQQPPELEPKRYVPTSAISALASAMRAGLSKNNVNEEEESDSKIEPHILARPIIASERPKSLVSDRPPPVTPRPRPMTMVALNDGLKEHPSNNDGGAAISTNSQSESSTSDQPPIVAIRPRLNTAEKTRPSTIAVENAESSRPIPTLPVKPRPASTIDSEISPSLASKIEESDAESKGESPSKRATPTPTSPIPRPRNFSRPLLPNSGSGASNSNLVDGTSPATPLSSLNSSPHLTGTDQFSSEPRAMSKEEEARYELARQAQIRSPVRQQPQIPLGPALQFKRKENSTSGDDKALEKVISTHERALEWLNTHLKNKGIEVTDLKTQLTDGLNLIYALEVLISQ